MLSIDQVKLILLTSFLFSLRDERDSPVFRLRRGFAKFARPSFTILRRPPPPFSLFLKATEQKPLGLTAAKSMDADWYRQVNIASR